MDIDQLFPKFPKVKNQRNWIVVVRWGFYLKHLAKRLPDSVDHRVIVFDDLESVSNSVDLSASSDKTLIHCRTGIRDKDRVMCRLTAAGHLALFPPR